MIIYIDILFCLNLFINYFLLLSVGAFNRIRPSFLRLLLGSMFGAFASFIIFFPQFSFFFNVGFKFLISAIIILCTFNFKNLKQFLKYFAYFFAVSFLFAGIMMGIWLAYQPNTMLLNNSVVYFNISPLFLIASTVISYLIIKIICHFWERKGALKNIYSVQVKHNGKSVIFEALLDTGNNLKDLFTGDPVIIVENSIVEPLLSEKARAVLSLNNGLPHKQVMERFRLIPYSAIGTKGLLPAFRPEKVIISYNKEQIQTDRITLALINQPIHSEYSALIGEDAARLFT